jgi:hypothetical protein
MNRTFVQWHSKASDIGADGQPLTSYNTASVTVWAAHFVAQDITFKAWNESIYCLLPLLDDDSGDDGDDGGDNGGGGGAAAAAADDDNGGGGGDDGEIYQKTANKTTNYILPPTKTASYLLLFINRFLYYIQFKQKLVILESNHSSINWALIFKTRP